MPVTTHKAYNDLHYTVNDGLTLYARHYPAESQSNTTTVLLLHGLTRNSADFEPLCDALPSDVELLVPDQRGRGKSDYDSVTDRYNPLCYVNDMWALLDHTNTREVIVIGTSMGGLMGMIMASQEPTRVTALALNDIGPEVDPRGLARLMSYVGVSSTVSDWQQAADYTRRINDVCFPDYSDTQWMAMARRIFVEDEQGTPTLAYDPAIAAPIQQSDENAVPPNLWPLYQSLQGMPLLLIRGALSDLLSHDCFARMQQATPDARAVQIAGVGHAPTLAEPEALKAITEFLSLC